MTVNYGTGEIVELAVSRTHAERWAERARLDLEGGADRIESGLTKIRTAISERHDLSMQDKYRSLTDYVAGEFGGALTQIGKVLGIDARRPVVNELTEAGMSTRAIGSVLGINDRTVRRDQGAAPAAPAPTPESAEEGEAEVGSGHTPQGGAAPSPTPSDEVPSDESGDTSPPRPAPVTGIDGKQYRRPEPKPKRKPLPDAARSAGWELRKAVERLERIASDDRFDANKDQVTPHLRSHLNNAVEVCQDLLARIDNN